MQNSIWMSTVVPTVTHLISLAETMETLIRSSIAHRIPSVTSAVVGTFTQFNIGELALSASSKTASVFVPEEGKL